MGYGMKSRKKKHILRNAGICAALVLALAAVAVGASFGIKGYRMYRDAISQFSLEERVDAVRSRDHFTKYEDLPEFYVNAVISAEDRRFWKHGGIDPAAICRALWVDLKSMSFEEGGSTITQQVAKNMLFTQEKKLERKAAECFAAIALEARCSKQEILELYVNTAYFGSNHYGIYDAAMGYFHKSPGELTEYEAAMLAGLPNAPSVYSPDTNRELAKKRTVQVLNSMVENRVLTKEEALQIRDFSDRLPGTDD